MAFDKWQFQSDPPRDPEKWNLKEGADLTIPNGAAASPADVLRPVTRTPFLLTGNGPGSTSRDIWNLCEFKSAGTLSGRIDTSTGSSALSPDGKFLTVTKKKSFTAVGAEVWSVAEGRRVKFLDVGPVAEPVIWSGFVSDTKLLTLHEQEQNQSVIRITDIAADNPITLEPPLPAVKNVDPNLVSVSPGGNLIAFGSKDGSLSIIGLKHKSIPTSMARPAEVGNCISIQFTPDGSELAALFESLTKANSEAHRVDLVIWGLTDGQLTGHFKQVNFTPESSGMPNERPVAMEWLADGSAVLLGNSTLVDRNSGRVVWQLKYSSGQGAKLPRILLGTELLLVPRNKGLEQGFIAYKLPWKDIDLALKALESQSEAWLKPGEKLSLAVDVGDVRFKPAEQLKAELTTQLEHHVHKQGFEIAADQRVTLRAKYSEVIGGILEKEDNSFPFPRPPRFPGFRRPFPAQGFSNESDRGGTGTAFVIHEDGYLLTCAHVVGATPSVQVKLGDKTYHARVVMKDVGHDYALLKIEVKNLVPLPLADSAKIELGEEVRAIGYPISTVLGESLKATRGTLAGLVKRDNMTMFQVDASINPGNSGGPLVNEKGEVIGINSAKLVGETIDNVGFSIPINEVKTMLKDQKVEFKQQGAKEKLAGPELVKRVTPSVAFVISTGGVDLGNPGAGQIASTRITAEFTLNVKDVPQPVWSQKIEVEPLQLRVQGTASDQKARDVAFELFSSRLSQLTLPYFVSKDSIPVVLPLVSESGDAGPAAAPVFAPRKTRRGM